MIKYMMSTYIFSLMSISKLAKMYDLQLFDASQQSTHGGSMRYYICNNRKYQKTSRLIKLLNNEKKLKLEKLNTYKQFAKRVLNSKKKTNRTVKIFKKRK